MWVFSANTTRFISYKQHDVCGKVFKNELLTEKMFYPLNFGIKLSLNYIKQKAEPKFSKKDYFVQLICSDAGLG